MYIFGYGSLINAASRQLTGQTGEAIPVIAHGLVRYWGQSRRQLHSLTVGCEPWREQSEWCATGN